MSCVEISGVVTAPKTFPISYRKDSEFKNVLHADVASYCDSNDLNCVTISKGMKDPKLLELVKSWNPSFFVVVGWYHLLPSSWIDSPAYGLHASLLPDYSGGALSVGINKWRKKTGISLFRMDKELTQGLLLGNSRKKSMIMIQLPFVSKNREKGLTLLREIPKLASPKIH